MLGVTRLILQHNLEARQKPASTYTKSSWLDDPLSKYKLLDVVSVWKRHKLPKLTSYILKKLKPSILSAITSYAGSGGPDMSIPAAKLAIQALLTYDPTKGAAVSTHVFHALKRLNRVSAARQNIIHVPENSRLLYGAVCRLQAFLLDKLGREPTVLLLADKTGLSLKKLKNILLSQTTVSQSSTLNLYQGKDIGGSSDLTDTDYIKYVYSAADPVNKKIILWSTPVFGRKPLSSLLIAKKLHITPSAVSQRRAKIQQQYQLIKDVL